MPGWAPGKLRAAAAALYRKEEAAPDNPFLASVAAVTKTDVDVWPENWPIVELFCRLGTQWNASMGGATGLRYEAVYPLLDRQFQGESWDQAFSDLQEMEDAALEAMHGKV